MTDRLSGTRCAYLIYGVGPFVQGKKVEGNPQQGQGEVEHPGKLQQGPGLLGQHIGYTAARPTRGTDTAEQLDPVCNSI